MTESVLCTIFKGNREHELYVYVPRAAGEDNIPEALRERMGKLSEVMTLKLDPDRKLARADTASVLKALAEQGYYVQLPPTISGQVLHHGD